MRVRASWAKTIDEMKGLLSKGNNAEKKMAKLRALSHKKKPEVEEYQDEMPRFARRNHN